MSNNEEAAVLAEAREHITAAYGLYNGSVEQETWIPTAAGWRLERKQRLTAVPRR